MSSNIIFLSIMTVTVFLTTCSSEKSAKDLLFDIYSTCLSEFSTNCIQPKTMEWLNHVADRDIISITNDLSIIRNENNKKKFINEKRINRDDKYKLLDEVDNFLATHSLRIKAPKELQMNGAWSIIPSYLLNSGLAQDLEIPLIEKNEIESRGFVKRVMLPFLLGLKFKTTVLVPVALALIALKAWKAMTLGLLSLVLSGALVVFKFTKPKIINYEVVQYPHHHVDNHADHLYNSPIHSWEHHGWSRQLDANQMAYEAHIKTKI